jgi:hypothetical protein
VTVSVAYCSRDDVMSALDVAETARTAAQIDRLSAAASRSVESLTHRFFYPTAATRYVDWPSDQHGTSYRVWLDGDHELVSLSAVTSGGVALTEYFLEPQGSGPPYTRLEVDLSGTDSLTAGDTHQRSLALTGVFGACADTAPASTLAASIDSSAASLAAAGGLLSPGHLIKVDDEYMTVTGRSLLTTGVTTSGALTAAKTGTSVTVSSAASFTAGEVITVDTERMLITDIAGSTLIVERAWSGSVLAAHSSGTTVYAGRTLTVARGQCGTQAAAHAQDATVSRHVPPPLVHQLTVAETLVALDRERSGYARTVGSGEATRNASGGDLADLRKQVYRAHGRKGRKAAV